MIHFIEQLFALIIFLGCFAVGLAGFAITYQDNIDSFDECYTQLFWLIAESCFVIITYINRFSLIFAKWFLGEKENHVKFTQVVQNYGIFLIAVTTIVTTFGVMIRFLPSANEKCYTTTQDKKIFWIFYSVYALYILTSIVLVLCAKLVKKYVVRYMKNKSDKQRQHNKNVDTGVGVGVGINV